MTTSLNHPFYLNQIREIEGVINVREGADRPEYDFKPELTEKQQNEIRFKVRAILNCRIPPSYLAQGQKRKEPKLKGPEEGKDLPLVEDIDELFGGKKTTPQAAPSSGEMPVTDVQSDPTIIRMTDGSREFDLPGNAPTKNAS